MCFNEGHGKQLSQRASLLNTVPQMIQHTHEMHVHGKHKLPNIFRTNTSRHHIHLLVRLTMDPELEPEPAGPRSEAQPSSYAMFDTVYHYYAHCHGEWRQDSMYYSAMTPSEVPEDWTLQDRIRAYLTLNAFMPRGLRITDSPVF